MSEFLYIVNIIVPIFIIIMIGRFAKSVNLINENFIKVSSAVVFYISLPSSLFLTISNSSFSTIFNFKLVLIAVVITFLSFLVGSLFFKVFSNEKTQKGAFIQGALRGNLAILGMVIIDKALSDQAYVLGAGLLVFLIPLYNFFSVLVLTSGEDKGGKFSRELAQLKKLMKNPLLISIFLGLIASFFGFRLPEVLKLPLFNLSKMTLPLALLGIGGTLHLEGLKSRLKPTIGITLSKLIIAPVMGVVMAYFLGITGEAMVVIFILTGSPVALASFAMASAMEGDTALTADAITVTTLLSLITVGVGLYLFKITGFY